MWSGPRNLSTAMMRSFSSRHDSYVTDEPFYSHYLKTSQLPHPGAAEVVNTHESDWRKVVEWLTGPIPEGKTIWYQKHMTMHMLPAFDRSFMRGLTNVFLIRHPARVIASYTKKREHPTLADIGFVQQAELFDQVGRHLVNPLHTVMDLLHFLIEPTRLRRGVQTPLDALEQHQTNARFRIGKQAADGRLRHVQQLRRLADGTGQHDRAKNLDLTKIEQHPLT